MAHFEGWGPKQKDVYWEPCQHQAIIWTKMGLPLIIPFKLQKQNTVFTKIIGHVGHFRWLGPNVWWEISQIWIEYIKLIGQMSDEPWKFFSYTENT